MPQCDPLWVLQVCRPWVRLQPRRGARATAAAHDDSPDNTSTVTACRRGHAQNTVAIAARVCHSLAAASCSVDIAERGRGHRIRLETPADRTACGHCRRPVGTKAAPADSDGCFVVRRGPRWGQSENSAAVCVAGFVVAVIVRGAAEANAPVVVRF
jgi:hypothetical protein